MSDNTGRRAAILHFIKQHRNKHGYSPTLREIASACGCGLTTVDYHVRKMADDGVITVDYARSRGIRIKGDE